MLSGLALPNRVKLPMIMVFLTLIASFVSCSEQNDVSLAPTPTLQPTAIPVIYPNPIPTPLINLTHADTDSISSAYPGVFSAEIAGRHIDSINFVVATVLADGRSELLYRQSISAEMIWHDGIHNSFNIWDGTILFLTDGENGMIVVADRQDAEWAVAGTVQQVDGSQLDATALFDAWDGSLSSLRTHDGDLIVQSETVFEPLRIATDVDQLTADPSGIALRSDQLSLRGEPLPDGDYQAGFLVENQLGAVSFVTGPITIANDESDTRATYLDPTFGFQLRYPAGWAQPTMVDGLVTIASATMQLAIRPNPDLTSAQKLKEEALNQWYGVTPLYEDTFTLDGKLGLRTYYGYFDPTGAQRTGVLLNFARDGVGYAVDIDGPASDEAQIVAIAADVLATWQQRVIDPVAERSAWTEVDQQIVPVGFVLNASETGWQQTIDTRDGRRFFARRIDPPTARTDQMVVNHWLNVSGQDVVDLQREPMQTIEYDGAVWSRIGFTYSADNTPIQGSLWARVDDSAENMIWIEAPSAEFAALEETALITFAANNP